MSKLTVITISSAEPTEIDLFETVEYDMDEQGKNIEAFPAELLMVQNPKLLNFAYLHVPLDEAWLRLLNAERKKEGLGSLSTDLFENMMDQIEKLWFDLVCLPSAFIVVFSS
jgi:hypothetical protein